MNIGAEGAKRNDNERYGGVLEQMEKGEPSEPVGEADVNALRTCAEYAATGAFQERAAYQLWLWAREHYSPSWSKS